MKKYIVSISATLAIFSLAMAFSFSIQPAQAQTVNCPAGYTCTPIVAQPVGCPVGFTCTPIVTTNPVHPTPVFPTSSCYVFYSNLGLGSTGSDVVALQTTLLTYGYDIPDIAPGSTAKGYFGSTTMIAVTKFQTAYGISSTGFVGPITRAKLNSMCASPITRTGTIDGGTPVTITTPYPVIQPPIISRPPVAIGNGGCYNFSTNLQIGSTGVDVIALQTWLINNGYSIPEISSGSVAKGNYDSQTSAAVSRYQSANNLTPTGSFDIFTRVKVNSCGSTLYTQPVTVVTNPLPPTTGSNGCYQFTTDLTIGSTGPDVVALQTWLIANGYSIPGISSGSTAKGSYDAQTASAVSAYQTAMYMPATGVLGALTRTKLNSSCNTAPTSTTGQSPTGDLAVTDFSWTPVNPTVGQSDQYIYFTMSIKNVGTGPLYVPSGTDFTITYNGFLVAQDEIGTGAFTLQPGESRTFSNVTSTQNQSGLLSQAGTFTLTFEADTGNLIHVSSTNPSYVLRESNLVQESAKNNNSMTKQITILPATVVTPPATPPTTPTAALCTPITINGTTYSLSPCTITATMVHGQGNKSFSATIVGSGSYGFSTRGYGVGFPTYGIIANTASGGAQGSFPLNLYFNDSYLTANGNQSQTYTGYLPIHIFQGSETGNDNNFLNLGITLTVNP